MNLVWGMLFVINSSVVDTDYRYDSYVACKQAKAEARLQVNLQERIDSNDSSVITTLVCAPMKDHGLFR